MGGCNDGARCVVMGGCNVDPPRRCNVGGFNVLISTVPQRGRREKSIGERKKLKGDLMNSKRQADY
jgi:hypothetical protein